MSEESAWQTFSQIKKREEKKLSNSNINYDAYRDASRQLNDIHVYDTDTTDSEDVEFFKKELKKNDGISPSLVTPPKSTLDSVHSSPSDNGTVVGRGEKNFSFKFNKKIAQENDSVNKEAIYQQKLNQSCKERRTENESAWTKFIKDNTNAVGNKIRKRDN